jgi:hypothetical protein
MPSTSSTLVDSDTAVLAPLSVAPPTPVIPYTSFLTWKQEMEQYCHEDEEVRVTQYLRYKSYEIVKRNSTVKMARKPRKCCG